MFEVANNSCGTLSAEKLEITPIVHDFSFFLIECSDGACTLGKWGLYDDVTVDDVIEQF